MPPPFDADPIYPDGIGGGAGISTGGQIGEGDEESGVEVIGGATVGDPAASGPGGVAGPGVGGGGDVGGGGTGGGQSIGRFDPDNQAPEWVYDGRYGKSTGGMFGGGSDFATPQGTKIDLALSDLYIDPDGDALSFNFDLPGGLSVDPQSGRITGSITEEVGTYAASFSVDDNNGNSVGTGIFWEILPPLPETGDLLITTQGTWAVSMVDGVETYTLAPASGPVYLGHANGVERLLRIENADEITIDSSGLHVKYADVYAEVSGTEDALFAGDFDLDLGTLETTKLTEKSTSAKMFQPALVDDFAVAEIRLQTNAVKSLGNMLVDANQNFGFGDKGITGTFDQSGVSFGIANLGSSSIDLTKKTFTLPFGGRNVSIDLDQLSMSYSEYYNSLFLSGEAKVEFGSGRHVFEVDLAGPGSVFSNLFEPGGRYIRIGDVDGDGERDYDISMEGSYRFNPKYGSTISAQDSLGLREFTAEIDTWNDVFVGSTEVRIPFLKSTLSTEVGFEWSPFALDKLKIGFDNLDVPLGPTGLYFNSGSLGVDDIDGSTKDGLVVEGEVGGYWGSPATKFVTASIGVENTKEETKLSIKAESKAKDWFSKSANVLSDAAEMVEKRLGLDLDAFLDTKLFEVEGSGTHKDDGTTKFEVEFKSLYETFQGAGSMEFSTANNGASKFLVNGEGRFVAPKSLAVIGGKELFAAGLELQIISDMLPRNDHLKIWTKFDVFNTEAAYGFEINGAYEFSWIGKDEIPLIGSWQLEPTMEWAIMTADWENETESGALIVITPDGDRLTEADIELRDDIEIVEDLSSGFSRSVAVATPASGIWDIEVAGDADYGEVTYEASNGIKLPEFLDWTTVIADETASAVASVIVQSPDADATVEFYIDTDTDNKNGQLITETPIEVTGQEISQEIDLTAFAPGTYYLYAVARGDNIAPVTTFGTAVDVAGYANVAVDILEGYNSRTAQHNYTINVTNDGTASAKDIVVDLTIPEADVVEFTPNSRTALFDEGVGSVAIAELAVGQSVSFDITLLIPDAHEYGEITAAVSHGGFDADPTDDTATFGLGTADDRATYAPSSFTQLADIGKLDEAGRLEGFAGDDILIGSHGDDRIIGGTGDDLLNGRDGADILNGGDGDDTIIGGASADDLRDVIIGGAGHDDINAGYGNDKVYGGQGNDTIAGGFGSDTLIGNAGDDLLTGSAFGDFLFGNAGDDFINGGFGADRVNGGTGADSFFHLGVLGHGSDWIQDYSAAQGDLLVFGRNDVTADQFHLTTAVTQNAGAATAAEAFITFKPTGQILWALVDGAEQDMINLQIGGDVFDLTF
ncbi:calcium-binding protein [Sulfitobacter sp. F26169L]|uniref:calcium-binding protein n=1 Tax=Sulfitobacter sp. F26169L TaxID=2996015 RepID=UPI002260FFFB|nr:calcium-binding protein [Sulfitobacter sp. F26169L]MCX7564958.1 calcium-binding protein [Sulfitobacter sp. F26169L]